jgi:hypothetical protein
MSVGMTIHRGDNRRRDNVPYLLELMKGWQVVLTMDDGVRIFGEIVDFTVDADAWSHVTLFDSMADEHRTVRVFDIIEVVA